MTEELLVLPKEYGFAEIPFPFPQLLRVLDGLMLEKKFNLEMKSCSLKNDNSEDSRAYLNRIYKKDGICVNYSKVLTLPWYDEEDNVHRYEDFKAHEITWGDELPLIPKGALLEKLLNSKIGDEDFSIEANGKTSSVIFNRRCYGSKTPEGLVEGWLYGKKDIEFYKSVLGIKEGELFKSTGRNCKKFVNVKISPEPESIIQSVESIIDYRFANRKC
ncbi:hypothetical protein KAJ38_02330 [Candidatus Pacearchaeota archaeon]|nr:hypothetical protein [Candidatus Pacearchaeota archaeon]